MGDEGFTHKDPVADQALDWFVSLRNGAPSAEASRAFADWLAEDSRHADEFLHLEDIWGAPGFRDAVPAAAPAQPGAIPLRPSPGRSAWSLAARAMAATAAAFVLAFGIWQGPHLWRIWQSDFHTAAGEPDPAGRINDDPQHGQRCGDRFRGGPP